MCWHNFVPHKSIPGRLKSISTSIDEKKYADAFAGRVYGFRALLPSLSGRATVALLLVFRLVFADAQLRHTASSRVWGFRV